MRVELDFDFDGLRQGDMVLCGHFIPNDNDVCELDAWYLVWPERVSDYSDDLADDEYGPELILFQPGSGEIAVRFSMESNINKQKFNYLLRDGWDKWDLMRLFNYDGKFSGLGRHVAEKVKELKRR